MRRRIVGDYIRVGAQRGEQWRNCGQRCGDRDAAHASTSRSRAAKVSTRASKDDEDTPCGLLGISKSLGQGGIWIGLIRFRRRSPAVVPCLPRWLNIPGCVLSYVSVPFCALQFTRFRLWYPENDVQRPLARSPPLRCRPRSSLNVLVRCDISIGASGPERPSITSCTVVRAQVVRHSIAVKQLE